MPFGKAFDKFEEKKERDEENEKLTEEKDFGEGDVIFKYYKQFTDQGNILSYMIYLWLRKQNEYEQERIILEYYKLQMEPLDDGVAVKFKEDGKNQEFIKYIWKQEIKHKLLDENKI